MHKKCAVCGKTLFTSSTPFCSLRCRTIDLGNWLGDSYRIATGHGNDDAGVGQNEQQPSGRLNKNTIAEGSQGFDQGGHSDDDNKSERAVKLSQGAGFSNNAFGDDRRQSQVGLFQNSIFAFGLPGKPLIN